MFKNHLSLLISCALLLTTLSQPAAGQGNKPAQTVETIKVKLAKLGVGEKAKATIRLKNGSKIKGYVALADEEDFVIRDRKTNAPTTIRYHDVMRVESNQGHSTLNNIAIGAGIGAGLIFSMILIAAERID